MDVYVGVIPGIFGYGISVVHTSEANAMQSLRNAYGAFKKAYPDDSTDFESSYERWGGRIVKVRMGDAYADDFAR